MRHVYYVSALRISNSIYLNTLVCVPFRFPLIFAELRAKAQHLLSLIGCEQANENKALIT